MANTPSTMLPLGTIAPSFSLPNLKNETVSLSDFTDKKAILVMFLSNHCPFVKHIISPLSGLIKRWQELGVGVIGIMSNDVEKYPDDSPRKMAEVAENLGFTFPYLYDESQEVALAYHAACTPDFFLFEGGNAPKLVYRGQLDGSRPMNDIEVNGKDLNEAILNTLSGLPPIKEQRPSMGCNIKWLEKNLTNFEPNYPPLK